MLGAMNLMCRRSKIQKDSLYYEHKHDGSQRLVGMNASLHKRHAGEIATEIATSWQIQSKKPSTLRVARRAQLEGPGRLPAKCRARDRKNAFVVLMEAVKDAVAGSDQSCTL